MTRQAGEEPQSTVLGTRSAYGGTRAQSKALRKRHRNHAQPNVEVSGERR